MASFDKSPDGGANCGKLLIIHADDLGMTHSINQSTFTALESGSVTSASVMAPCPWFPEVAEFARAHPDADLGIHLTLTCGWSGYRWGPISGRDRVPSLLDPDGYFWPSVRLMTEHVRVREAEIELRAQIEYALQAGIIPTHLDSHMFAHQPHAELFTAYRRIAREYRLPFLMVASATPSTSVRTRCLRAIEHHPRIGALFGRDRAYPRLAAICDLQPDTEPSRWKEAYLNLLRSMKPGITQLIVHLAYDDDEMKALAKPDSPWGAQWRQRDCDVVNSPEFTAAIKENGILLVGWKHLTKSQAEPASGGKRDHPLRWIPPLA